MCLLDAEPGIARVLDAEQRAAAAVVQVPVEQVAKGVVEIRPLLEARGAFGAIVLDGMLLSQLQVADHAALRLIGPGDVISFSAEPPSMLVVGSSCRAAAHTRLALLGSDVMLAAHRWPRILSALHARMAEQSERLTIQLAICQLPRVDQRLLALMWLLAESWGRVTSLGTTLPITLTHDALGGLIGARRPTVTLALGELTERGAIIRQDAGWLLLEGPPKPSGTFHAITAPELIDPVQSRWSSAVPATHGSEVYSELLETVGRLREQHLQEKERLGAEMRRLQTARTQRKLVRQRIAVSRRQAPSS